MTVVTCEQALTLRASLPPPPASRRTRRWRRARKRCWPCSARASPRCGALAPRSCSSAQASSAQRSPAPRPLFCQSLYRRVIGKSLYKRVIGNSLYKSVAFPPRICKVTASAAAGRACAAGGFARRGARGARASGGGLRGRRRRRAGASGRGSGCWCPPTPCRSLSLASSSPPHSSAVRVRFVRGEGRGVST